MRTLLTIMISLNGFFAICQDITHRSVIWSVTKTVELQSGKSLTEASTLIVYKSDSIAWCPAHQPKEVYKITSAAGLWNNLNAQGEVTYQVTCTSGDGVINIRNTVAGIQGTVVIKKPDGTKVSELLISSGQDL